MKIKPLHHALPKVSTRHVVDKNLCRDKKNCPLDKPFGWGKPSRQVVDIFRCPLDNFDHLTDRAKTRNRQTQTTLEDLPFQLIEKKKKWWLVKLADDTFGWLPAKQIKRIKDLNYWDKVKLTPKNKTIPLPYHALTKIRRIFGEFKEIPYLWGGTAKRGMDCSAFVQKIFLRLFGILLPRNSREQKNCGKFVYLKSICPLDILFFVHSTTSRHHVGVYLDKKVWHFCLDKKGLSIESFGEIKKRYRYLAARRIIKLKNVK